MNKIFGGKVEKKSSREDGQFKIDVDTSSPLFRYGTFCIIMFITMMIRQIKNCKFYSIFQWFKLKSRGLANSW